METRNNLFSEEIAEIISEISKDFIESKPEDPITWFKDVLKRECMLSDEEAELKAKELIKGILLYRKNKNLEDPMEQHKDKFSEEDKIALKEQLEIIKNKIKEEVKSWKRE